MYTAGHINPVRENINDNAFRLGKFEAKTDIKFLNVIHLVCKFAVCQFVMM